MRVGVMLRAFEDRQGIGIYTQNLMDHLLPLDRRNEYVLFYRNPALVGRYARFPNVAERALAAPNKALWDQVRMPLAARRERLDLIFHTKFTVPLLTRRKTVMTVHGASWFVRPELYGNKLDLAYIRAVMPLYCRKADFIIANSDLTTRDFIRILKVPPAKIRTVRLGTNEAFRPVADPALLDAARREYSLPEHFILSVIRRDPRKNFANLIAAFRLLRGRIPCKLVVAGLGVEKYREEYGLDADGTAADVTFLGWVEPDRLPALYTLARCLFFPSVYEEFGIPVCEAMACGCPPVVSSTGALPEVAGDAGLIVDPFDPPRMAEALQRVCADDALHRDLAARCLARAREFTWERCARETLDILNGAGGS
jgi:glycosyltransferase involved in cell wall biosynthesis